MTKNGINVLVVDDDEGMRATLADFISQMGMGVQVVCDVGGASMALLNAITPFDIVLADLKLPGGTGLDVLKAAHARAAGTLVAIVTGFASMDTAIAAIRAGAHDYITKPFSLEEIGVVIRNMVERIRLARENSRLSTRLQEVLAQLHQLQAEKGAWTHAHDDIRRGLDETSRKLDLLMAAHLGNNRVAGSGSQPFQHGRQRQTAAGPDKQ